MKIALRFLILLLSFWAAGQNAFEFPKNTTKDKIDIQLINNLMLLPVEVNGVALTFLLDTGASSTVIFSFEETDSLQLNDSKVVKLRGLGKGEPVDAIKSENNLIKVGKAIKKNQVIYVVFDGALNFSSRLGVPVHGIIGYDFMKDFIVEVNNDSERLRFYQPESYTKRKCRKCLDKELLFIKDKPHISGTFESNGETKEVNLLIDSGSGDALWLFESEENNIQIPENAFEDYLGLGINGNIYGKRSKVDGFSIGDYNLKNVNTAYPDIGFLDGLNLLDNRQGSIGGELLKRFNWVIDYGNKTISLRKNRYFKAPFHYNMSGLTLQHGSFTLVRERKDASTEGFNAGRQEQGFSVYKLNLGTNMEIRLEQIYVVVDVRENSPAAIAGIREGDEILEVNSVPIYKYKLHELNEMFYAKEGRTMRMKILRNGYEQRVKFDLKDI